jgi:hypothetical protein
MKIFKIADCSVPGLNPAAPVYKPTLSVRRIFGNRMCVDATEMVHGKSGSEV